MGLIENQENGSKLDFKVEELTSEGCFVEESQPNQRLLLAMRLRERRNRLNIADAVKQEKKKKPGQVNCIGCVGL